jgi:TPR repeat protein
MEKYMKKIIQLLLMLVMSNAFSLTNDEVLTYEKSANYGNPIAQFILGTHHLEKFNNEKAVKWLSQAAESGLIGAQNNLGYMFESGQAPGGTDFQEAFKWYLKAANQGGKVAQFNVCLYYYNGDKGVTRHMSKATDWCQKSADQGYNQAQDLLEYMAGDLYY